MANITYDDAQRQVGANYFTAHGGLTRAMKDLGYLTPDFITEDLPNGGYRILEYRYSSEGPWFRWNGNLLEMPQEDWDALRPQAVEAVAELAARIKAFAARQEALEKTYGYRATRAAERGGQDFDEPMTKLDKSFYMQFFPRGRWAARIVSDKAQSVADTERARTIKRATQLVEFCRKELLNQRAWTVDALRLGLCSKEAAQGYIEDDEETLDDALDALEALEASTPDADPVTREDRIGEAMLSGNVPVNYRGRYKLGALREITGIPDVSFEERNRVRRVLVRVGKL